MWELLHFPVTVERPDNVYLNPSIIISLSVTGPGRSLAFAAAAARHGDESDNEKNPPVPKIPIMISRGTTQWTPSQTWGTLTFATGSSLPAAQDFGRPGPPR